VAASYGLETAVLAKAEDAPDLIRKFWQNPHEPFLLEVEIDLSVNAYPKLAFGRPISEMEPFAKPVEMEAT